MGLRQVAGLNDIQQAQLAAIQQNEANRQAAISKVQQASTDFAVMQQERRKQAVDANVTQQAGRMIGR